MATILNDQEIKKLLGTVIKDGSEECVRPNGYVLRLGKSGEFTNTEKGFELKSGKGINLHPGNIVNVTSFETVDFRKEVVDKLYPGCHLHGFLSPTTDLSREGLTVSSTQVDAGYHGTLNWAIHNHSSRDAKFFYSERLFRMTIFLLREGENPESPYDGDYQDKMGFVSSQRKGAPVGMKNADWVDHRVEGGQEDKIEELIKSGYPWNLLGLRLKAIDKQFATVTEEYSEIFDSIKELRTQITEIKNRLDGQKPIDKKGVKEIVKAEHNHTILKAIGGLFISGGILIPSLMDESISAFIKGYSIYFMFAGIVCGVIIFVAMASRED